MWIFRDSRKSRIEKSSRPALRSYILLAACCLLSTAYRLSAAQGLYEMREIKPGIFLWIPEDVLEMDSDPLFNQAANAGFIVTSQGVIVVNTTNSPFHGRELLYEIRQRTEEPIRYVINTDSRGDHMLGNEVFASLQATIMSTLTAGEEMQKYQEELTRRLQGDFRLISRMRGFHPTLPTQTFNGEVSTSLGGMEFKILEIAGGHSAGDAVVLFPASKVLFLGHLFEHARFPRMDTSDVRRWIEILRKVEGWDVETYVPAHGPPGDKKLLIEFREFLEWLETEVKARVEQGQPLSQVKQEVRPPERFRWGGRDLAARAVEGVYRQLAAQFSPSPTSPPTPEQPSQTPAEP